MSKIHLTPEQIDGIIQLIPVLIPIVGSAARAIAGAIRAIVGNQTEEQIVQAIMFLETDARFNAAVAHADAGRV